MDYRRTKYCPELIDVPQKKKEVEALVKAEHPYAKTWQHPASSGRV